MKQPLISIIVPIYKVELYLARCLNSIIHQTYSNLEIILVDDGSPDKCGDICEEYKLQDSRIRIIHKENGGLSDARNAGLDISTGEYIALVDSDDWVAPNYIQVLFDLIKNNGADISICNLLLVYNNEEIINADNNKNVEVKKYTNIQALEQYFEEYSLQMIVAHCKLYKAELFKNIRYPLGKIHEDEYTTYKLLYSANKVMFTTSCLYYYFQRSDSIIGAGFNLNGRYNYLEAIEERILFYKQISLKILWENTIRGYFEEIIYIYDKQIQYKGKKEDFNILLKKARRLHKSILSSGFNFKFRAYYLMFILFPRTTIKLHKLYMKSRSLLNLNEE